MPEPALEPTSSFLDRARYPKGRKTLQAILDATYELIISEGLGAASQEAIARRANVTQSAVRHYFPTKEELLQAFFITGIERMRSILKARSVGIEADPRAHLLESASLHYDRILEVKDSYYFEAAAYAGRIPKFRAVRDRWYQELGRYYAQLLQTMHPDWDEQRCVETAYQVLTLVLGGWITLGSSRPLHKRRPRKALKATLLQGIERLIS